LGFSFTSRIGVSPAETADCTIESKPPQEYPGEFGSLATNPDGRVAGAMLRHGTMSRTYVAPAARDLVNAVSC
jgi:hypothetical protein